MNQVIKVSPPVNLNKADKCYFRKLSYELPPLHVYELSNVLITYNGKCLINSTLVEESIQDYRDLKTINALQAKLDIITNKTMMLFDSNYYLLIHQPLFSYYHWSQITSLAYGINPENINGSIQH